jgi:hypothetical protein
MMYSEFVERTGVYVGIAEFDAIVEVYNNSDVDKDEFCKLWAKMNFARVKAEKEQKAKDAKEAKAIEYITKMYNKLSTKLNKDFMVNFNMLAIHVIGSASYKKLVDAMHVCGIIEIDEYCPLGHYVSTLDTSINEYWDKVAEKHI